MHKETMASLEKEKEIMGSSEVGKVTMANSEVYKAFHTVSIQLIRIKLLKVMNTKNMKEIHLNLYIIIVAQNKNLDSFKTSPRTD